MVELALKAACSAFGGLTLQRPWPKIYSLQTRLLAEQNSKSAKLCFSEAALRSRLLKATVVLHYSESSPWPASWHRLQ